MLDLGVGSGYVEKLMDLGYIKEVESRGLAGRSGENGEGMSELKDETKVL